MVKSFVTGVRQLDWQPYAWLVYSIPYLVSSFNQELSLGETAAMLAGFVVFLVAYLLGPRMRPVDRPTTNAGVETGELLGLHAGE